MNDTYSKCKYFQGVHLDAFDCHRELNKLLTERYEGICQDNEEQEVISYSHEYFESLEREGMLRIEVKVNFEDSTKNFSYEAFLLKYGKPGYISWLIQNVDFFSLSTSCVRALEELDVNTFLGVRLKKIDKSTFEPFVNSSKRKEIFSENIKKLNSDKWVKFYSENKHLFQSVYYGYERNDFRDDTRLGFGGDNDEDNIMRGLGSGNGDLLGF
ncbi:hypothetical protein GCM10027422_42010 [Hymenobacter arcticus]